MKKSTIDRIVKNANNAVYTNIGRYTYTCNLYTGEIQRCKKEDIDRHWIANDGTIFSAWETVAHA